MERRHNIGKFSFYIPKSSTGAVNEARLLYLSQNLAKSSTGARNEAQFLYLKILQILVLVQSTKLNFYIPKSSMGTISRFLYPKI